MTFTSTNLVYTNNMVKQQMHRVLPKNNHPAPMRERSFFERQWLSAVSVLAVPALPHSAPLSGHCEHSWRQWWFCKGRQTCCLWTRLSKKRLGGFVPSHFNQQQSWWHQGKTLVLPTSQVSLTTKRVHFRQHRKSPAISLGVFKNLHQHHL